MKAGTAYQLGTYVFVVATENPRVHNLQVTEHQTLANSFVLQNMQTVPIRVFSITERTQDVKDIQFLEMMASVPQTFTLKTERGTFTVAIDEINIFQKVNYYEVQIRLFETSAVYASRVIVTTPTVDLTDSVISVDIEPTQVGRAGTITLTCENKDSDQSFLADTADNITVYAGLDRELWNIGTYYIDKTYYPVTASGWLARFEGRTASAQKLADNVYASDEVWATTTTIYDLIAAADTSAILEGTSLSANGVDTLLSSRYLTSQRIVKAGTTKLQALSDLISYIYTDLSEEWVAFTSDSADILFVQPASAGGTVDHSFEYGSNIIDANITKGHGAKNWIEAQGITLETTYASTTWTDRKTDANYAYKHNCACLPTYERVYVVLSDTGNTVGIVASYDDTNGYIEHFYDSLNTTLNCCFPYSNTQLLIGTDSKIVEYTITESGTVEILKDDCKDNVYSAVEIIDSLPYVIFATKDEYNNYFVFEAYRNSENNWIVKKILQSSSGLTIGGVHNGADGNIHIPIGGSNYLKYGYKDTVTDYIAWENIISTYAAQPMIVTGTVNQAKKWITYIADSYPQTFKTQYYDGSTWSEISSLGSVYTTALSRGVVDKPRVAYVTTTGNIAYRLWGTTTWGSEESVDAAGTAPVQQIGIKMDNTWVSHIVYCLWDGSTLTFKHAYKNGAWSTETIEAISATTLKGRPWIKITFDSSNTAHVVYYDASDGSLKGASKVSGSWMKKYLKYPEVTVSPFVNQRWFGDIAIHDTDQISIVWGESNAGGVGIAHENYLLWGPELISDLETGLDSIIAFQQLSTDYFALTNTAKLIKSSTPLTPGSWSLIKDFGTLGIDLQTDGTYLYVCYDDKIDYGSGTITSSTTFTNLIDNSGTDFQCMGKACNVLYAGDTNGSLYSWTDLTYTKTETDSDHGMSTNTIYSITDCMGDVFVGYATSGAVRRLKLTFYGDDTNWVSEAVLSAVATPELQKYNRQGLIALQNGHFYTATVETPESILRMRTIARDLTDINTNGKLAENFTSPGTLSPSNLCIQAKAELTNRLTASLFYDLTVPWDHTIKMNDLCSVDIEGFSGAMEVRAVRHRMSIRGSFTETELGGKFPNLAQVIDDWTRGGEGGASGSGSGGYVRHDLLSNLTWSSAGHTIDTGLDMNSNSITELANLTMIGTATITGAITQTGNHTITGNIIITGDITSAGDIDVKPSGDTDDYITIYTTGNVPRFKAVGGDRLYIESDDASYVRLGIYYDATHTGLLSYDKSNSVFVVQSSHEINFIMNGDVDDYIQFSTAANEPIITTIGSCDLNITPTANLVLNPTGIVSISKSMDINGTITSSNAISIKPSGDTDDYLEFSTTANVVSIRQPGGNDLNIVTEDSALNFQVNNGSADKNFYMYVGTTASRTHYVQLTIYGSGSGDEAIKFYHGGTGSHGYITTGVGNLQLNPAGDRIVINDKILRNPKRYSQAAEPSLGLTGDMALWRDTDDGKVYLLYNDADSGQVKVELT